MNSSSRGSSSESSGQTTATWPAEPPIRVCRMKVGINGRAIPFIPTFIRHTRIGGSAGQVAVVWPELSEDEPLEDEFIQVGYLSLRSEGPPGRGPLVVKAEVKPASLLIADVLISNQDTCDVSTNVTLHLFAGQQCAG